MLSTVLAVHDGTESALSMDKRLKKVVPLILEDRPLFEILHSVSKVTGVPLLSDEEVGTLRASFLVKNETMGKALQVLADCLRLSWKKERNSYRLYRTPDVARADEQRAAADAIAYARVQAKVEDEHRQLTEFVKQVFIRSHLTDDEVRQLAGQYPPAAEIFERSPWNVVAVRVASWLTPEQWEKAMDKGVWLDYDEWTLTGPDADLLSPQRSPSGKPIYKPEGRSGIQRIYVRIQRDGTLHTAVRYHSVDGSTAMVRHCRF